MTISVLAKRVCFACLVCAALSALTAQTTPTALAAQTVRTAPAPPTKGPWEKVFLDLMAQDTANAHGHSSVSFSPAIMSIPGKPFTATRVYTDQRQENGSDVGNPITANFTIARDEKGRVHYEMAFEEKSKQGQLVIGGFDIQIYDPVAHTITRYFADADHAPPPDPVAKVRKLKLMSELSKPIPPDPPKQQTDDSDSVQPEPPPAPAASSKPAPPPPVKFIPTKDTLPVQSVDGIPVVIHRVILKYGDKQQFIQIDENWLSPDYAIDVRRTTLRETIGNETVETKDIIPGPPDPALFEVPPGYRKQLEP